MAQVLNDEHHEKLLCSQCQRYLSVFPVKVYQDGSVKCGRCCQNDDGGVPSIYEEIAKNCLFKCINRYEGCKKLLLPSVVSVHEQTCKGRVYNCPSCRLNQRMSAFQFIQHYKQNHPTLCLLSTNNFTLRICNKTKKFIKKFLYIKDDEMFSILVQYIPNLKQFQVVTICFRKLHNVQQHFVITCPAIAYNNTTEKRNCLFVTQTTREDLYKIDVNRMYNQVVNFEIKIDMSKSLILSNEIEFTNEMKSEHDFNQKNVHQLEFEPQASRVELTPQFHEQYPHYQLTCSGTALYSNSKKQRIELTCSSCKKMMADKVYICDLKKHLLCWDCSVWCSLCEYNGTVSPEELTKMSKYLLFSCKWKCGTKCTLDDLELHQIYCTNNKRDCPICHITVTHDLQYHMNKEHNCTLTQCFNLAEFLTKNQNISSAEEYFIMNNHLFKIVCKKNKLLKTIETTEAGTIDYVYNLCITPCDDLNGLELYVTEGETCQKVENGKITVTSEDGPQLFLKNFQ